jgi:hypothetical protein
LWPFAEGIKEHREEPQPEYSISWSMLESGL